MKPPEPNPQPPHRAQPSPTAGDRHRDADDAARAAAAKAQRRQWLGLGASLAVVGLARPGWVTARGELPGARLLTVYTFGDSVLDCARYNDAGIQPGQLLVRNDDALFPEFRGRDLQSRSPARLDHRAVDGATVDGLDAQLAGVAPEGASMALLSIGGNDLLRGLAADTSGKGLRIFAHALRRFTRALPVRPLLLATVYDPTFGDDSRNFLPGVDARIARANHRRINELIGEQAAAPHNQLVDLHAHFLTRGDPSWFTRTIEPSARGASEVRRAFADVIGLQAKV